MAKTTFDTSPVLLHNLLKTCAYAQTQCIPVPEVYADDFTGFRTARQKLLLNQVVSVTIRFTPVSTASADEGEGLTLAIVHDSALQLIDAE